MSIEMTNTNPQAHRWWRSTLAVFLGLLTIVVLSIATDSLLHATGVFPPVGQPMSDALFLLALAYRALDSIIGCFLAAWLAPNRPLAHGLALGGVGVVISLAGVVATWGGDPALGPLWYPVALVLIALPCGWLGGVLFQRWRPAR